MGTVQRIKLYHDSLFRYEGLTSPYLYPRYGLGELPQVRLAAPAAPAAGGVCGGRPPSAAVAAPSLAGKPRACCVRGRKGRGGEGRGGEGGRPCLPAESRGGGGRGARMRCGAVQASTVDPCAAAGSRCASSAAAAGAATYSCARCAQSFARLSAVYGGTYMLNKPDVQVRGTGRRRHQRDLQRDHPTHRLRVGGEALPRSCRGRRRHALACRGRRNPPCCARDAAQPPSSCGPNGPARRWRVVRLANTASALISCAPPRAPPSPRSLWAQVVYDEAGKAVGVTSEGETAKAKLVVGDPSYFPDKVKAVARVVRAIAIMVSVGECTGAGARPPRSALRGEGKGGGVKRRVRSASRPPAGPRRQTGSVERAPSARLEQMESSLTHPARGVLPLPSIPPSPALRRTTPSPTRATRRRSKSSCRKSRSGAAPTCTSFAAPTRTACRPRASGWPL